MTEKEIFTNTVKAPAQLLDKTVVSTQRVAAALPNNPVIRRTKNYWHLLGPGLTTGASDDDPSGIATYSQTGAQYGFQLIWLSAATFPLMAVVQEMCARIGMVTGRGLAANIRTHFSRKLLYTCTLLLFAANTFNIGADLGAMAKGIQLLRPSLSFPMLVIGLSLFCILLQVFTPYARYAKYLKYLAMVLLAYVASAILAHLNWGNVLRHSFTPHVSFNKTQILLICAILGTTISPYLFFWQTSQEIEERIMQGKTTVQLRRGATKDEVGAMRLDVWSGMLLSNVVMFFIVAACGAELHAHGITNINTASQAAQALRPFAGNATYLLFAVGIVGTGLLAIPVLAGSSSYAIAESSLWREGLYRKLKEAYAFYGVIIFSLLIGLALNFVGLNPIKALIYSAVGNGIVAPVVLVFIVMLSSNKRIMGEWVNKRYVTVIGWVVTILMAVSGVAAIIAIF
jgi:NRAMP (natural resistance-associated macrophage protein)-like metal ion transporter